MITDVEKSDNFKDANFIVEIDGKIKRIPFNKLYFAKLFEHEQSIDTLKKEQIIGDNTGGVMDEYE